VGLTAVWLDADLEPEERQEGLISRTFGGLVNIIQRHARYIPISIHIYIIPELSSFTTLPLPTIESFRSLAWSLLLPSSLLRSASTPLRLWPAPVVLSRLPPTLPKVTYSCSLIY